MEMYRYPTQKRWDALRSSILARSICHDLEQTVIDYTDSCDLVNHNSGVRGDGGTLGHWAYGDTGIFGSCVVHQKLESLGWRVSDISYHLL